MQIVIVPPFHPYRILAAGGVELLECWLQLPPAQIAHYTKYEKFSGRIRNYKR